MLRRATAQDNRLTFQARGMLAYLLSKPDTWEIQPAELQAAGRCGRDRVHKILSELEEYGYLTKEQPRIEEGDDKGRFAANVYTLRESPSTENPLTVNPSTENPVHIEVLESRESTERAESLAPPPTASKRPTPPKSKKPAAIKTLVDLNQLQRIVAINAHRIKNGQGLNGRTMTRINMAVKDLRERFTDAPIEPDELARAYKWHCAQDGAPAAPKDSVKICDMVQAYRDAHPFKLSSNGNLNPADPDCPMCEGKGVYSYDVPYGDPRFGKTEVCACRKPGTQEAA